MSSRISHANFYGADNALTLVSSTLMTSGSDNLRNALGTVVTLKKDSAYDYNYYRAFVFKADGLDADTTADTVEDLRGIEVVRIPCESDKIAFIETNPANISRINRSVATPNYKIPFRLYANEDTVYGDVHWREIFTGGQWADENFTNLIDTSKTYYDCTTTIAVPLNYKELRKIEFDTTVDLSEVPKCSLISNYLDYNHLAQDYQNWATGLSNELLIPNYDIVSSYYYNRSREASEGSVALDAEDAALAAATAATIEKQIGWSEEKTHVYKYHFPYCYETEDGDEYYNFLEKDQYFGAYFVNTGDNLAYREAATTHQQNIIYDQHYYDFLKEHSIGDYEELLGLSGLDVDKKLTTFYNITLEFDRHIVQPPTVDLASGATTVVLAGSDLTVTPTTLPAGETEVFSYEKLDRYVHKMIGDAGNYRFTKIIDQYNFSSKFLEILKDIDEGTITDVKRNMLDFHYTHKKQIAVPSDDVEGGMVLQHDAFTLDLGQKITLPSTNFLHFLLYSYNNFDVALNDNYIFMGPSRPEHVATSATDSLYRNMNSQNIIGVIDAAYDIQNAYFRQLAISPGVDFVLKSESILENLMSPKQKFREVLAYKIEKFASTPTGDYSTQTPIQKFWMFNAPNAPNKLKLTDSQVKYGKDYTYKITAYTLVVSHKYKYQDFRLTKQIGTGKLLPDATSTLQYCLQFYNPNNNQVSSQLLTPIIDSTLDEVARSAIQGLNEFASSEIEVTEFPQVADFHLYIEPCLELIEIPFYQKTIKVLENPPNAINVVPFHFIDNSNRLGFKIGQDSFIQRTYPEIITAEDSVLREKYLSTKEYILSNKIVGPSESPARYIEMYRIRKKPTSFSDFKDALVATMDLRIPNDVYNYADHIAADEIFPNRKYYYVFRLLNENRMPGPLSQIIEAELVNDGGYVYSLFDTVDSSEFNPNKVTTNTVAFKKIMQIEPHLNQMSFDLSEVDYNDYASNQVDNITVGTVDELIWDKKFKIRLTSKKTGKKLDLNMSFNQRVKDLSKLREIPAPPNEVCEPSPPQLTQDQVPIEEVDEISGEDFEKSSYDCSQAPDVPDDPVDGDPGGSVELPPAQDDDTEGDPGEDEDDSTGGGGEPDDPQDPVNGEAPPDDTNTDEDTIETTEDCECNDSIFEVNADDMYITGFQEKANYIGTGDWAYAAAADGVEPPGVGLPNSMIEFLFKGLGLEEGYFMDSWAMDNLGPIAWVLTYIRSKNLVDPGGIIAVDADYTILNFIYNTIWYYNNKYYCEDRSLRCSIVTPSPEMLYAQMLTVLHYAGLYQARQPTIGAPCTAMMAHAGPDDVDGVDTTAGQLFLHAQVLFRNWIEADESWFPSAYDCWEDVSICGEEIGLYESGHMDSVFRLLRMESGSPDLGYDSAIKGTFISRMDGGTVSAGNVSPFANPLNSMDASTLYANFYATVNASVAGESIEDTAALLDAIFGLTYGD